MLGVAIAGVEIRNPDARARRIAELDLGCLRRLLESLQRRLVLAKVNSTLPAKLVGQVFHYSLVVVVSPQPGVAVHRLDLEQAVTQLQDGDIEGSATQVPDQDGVDVLYVQAVGERCSRGFVDYPQRFDAGDGGRIDGRLALADVEVGGDANHGFPHLLAQIAFSGRLYLPEDHRRDLFRRVLPLADPDPEVRSHAPLDLADDLPVVAGAVEVQVVAPPHPPLDGEDGAVWVGDSLQPGQLPHEPASIPEKADHRRRQATALGVRYDHRSTAIQVGHGRVGGP